MTFKPRLNSAVQSAVRLRYKLQLFWWAEPTLRYSIFKGIVATRQLAKRQLTWLRKEENAIWLDPM